MLRLALAFGLMAAPAFAQMIDLPRLTWPTDTTATVTQGCDDPTSLDTMAHCDGK